MQAKGPKNTAFFKRQQVQIGLKDKMSGANSKMETNSKMEVTSEMERNFLRWRWLQDGDS